MVCHAMNKLSLLFFVLLAATGCESVWVVPPANGQVVDARSGKPVAQAQVTRMCADASAKTKTDVNGYFKFHGQRAWRVAFGDPLCAPASYRIDVVGYQSVETNGFAFGWANQSGLRHNLGEIQITPK
jgi:hypothetical protein